MTTAEKIAVMQAYVDGKQIQTKNLGGAWINWDCGEAPSWDWGRFEYRIKPEPKAPAYRPYKDFAEFFADWNKHGGWIKDKCDKIEFCGIFNPTWLFSSGYEWADDGSPCGVLVEEGGEA